MLVSSTPIRTLREGGLRDFLGSIYHFGVWRLAETETVQDSIMDRCIDEDHLSRLSARSIRYGSGEQIHVNDPVCTHGLGDFFDLSGRYEIPELSVYEVEDVKLVGPHALTLSNTGEYMFANASNRRMGLSIAVLETAISKLQNWGYQEGRTIESAVSLVGPFVRNYFHWFVDYLPRLFGMEAYERETEEKPTVIYPKDPPSWLFDMLSLLVEEDRLVEWDESECHVKSLVVPSVRRGTTASSNQVFFTDALEWVRNEVLTRIQPNHEGPDRIYVSRNDAKERRVENESGVVDLLSEYGFQPFTLSELSFREQVRLFYDAECIVSPHGSGLTNMIWTEDSQIIELFGDLTPQMYFTMANQLGHEYAAVFGEQIGPDICIDITELRDTVECVLSRE
jgi:hypothetical protein